MIIGYFLKRKIKQDIGEVMAETNEGGESYESLTADYAEQLEEIDPSLSWQQRVQRSREAKETKRLSQMMDSKTDEQKVRLLIDEQLSQANHLEQAFAILGFVQRRSDHDLKAYEHVLREYGDEEKMREELNRGKKNTKKALDDLEVSLVVGETSEESDEIADDLGEDVFAFHHGDIRRYLAARENLQNVAWHSKRISPFIQPDRRNDLLAIGAKAIDIKIEGK